MNNFSDILAYVLAIGGIVLFVACYAKALTEVKAGRLVVYRDWGDFIKASLWALLIPYGACSLFLDNGDGNWPSHALGVVAIVGGCVSFWWACAGAYRYNTGTRRGLALFARFAATLLFVFALGKLTEKFKQFRRGEAGVIDGVLIPAILFAWVFHALIQPMIGSQYAATLQSIDEETA